MATYNDRLLRGDSPFGLDEDQRKLVDFEEDQLRAKYEKFLRTASSEAQMHYFLESNPVLIPGLYDLHNGPVGNVVISKLRLSDEFVTDFAFISENSAVCQVTLVEIESPRIQVFRKSDGLFTSEFSRALQQLRDWDQWCAQNPVHLKDTFRRVYHRTIFKYQRVFVRCVLVAGRRSELVRSARREQRWAAENRDPSVVVMTYDRLLDFLTFNPRMLQRLRCVPQGRVATAVRNDD
jgi:hypothetical protein